MHVYRKLVPAEIGLFHDHLLRLTPEDRLCRFAGLVSDERIAEYCSHVDWFRSIVIGCFIDGVLRGVAELRLDDPRIGWRAELAVTVEEAWQSRGIGTELLRRAITVCRNRAIRSIDMICLVANRRMQRIARRFEADLIVAEGAAEAKVALPFPDQFTLAREFLEEGAAWMLACMHLPTRRAAGMTSN
jgi:GNAT superfamily N-acetyltransferase